MARYGYMMLDPQEVDVSRQALQLDGIGGFERIFIDRFDDGSPAAARSERKQRQRMLMLLQPGDVVYTAAADRLADHLRDFIDVWQTVKTAQSELVVLEEHLDSRSPAGRQSLKILQKFERLEFNYHSQRKKAGIKAARDQGRRIGRPPVAVPPDFRQICRQWSEGKISGREAARLSGLRSTSFYKKAAELGFRPFRKSE